MRQQLRKFGPKSSDHPSIGQICSLCGKPFVSGDYTTLLPLEGGFASKEDMEKAVSGRAYTTEAEEVHYDCATK